MRKSRLSLQAINNLPRSDFGTTPDTKSTTACKITRYRDAEKSVNATATRGEYVAKISEKIMGCYSARLAGEICLEMRLEVDNFVIGQLE